MAEMMDLYNEAENSVLGTLIADARSKRLAGVHTGAARGFRHRASRGRFLRPAGRCTAAAM